MTAPVRSAASRAYRLAVPLSLASAGLGLGRELLVLQKLGLSSTNDLLQFYLSVTYTVSLLGDAIRLGVLNLLQGGGLSLAVASAALVAVASGVPLTLWYAHGGPGGNPWLLAAAGLAGVLNLLTVVLLVHRQRAGRFLPAHVITILPNVMIFAGVGVAMLGPDDRFLAAVVLLFLAAPVLQLALLLLLRTPGGDARRGPGAEAGAVAAGVGQIGLHGLGAVGAQAGQVLIRTTLAAQAPGMLTVFVLLSRAVDTVRAILLDTFIGARLADWSAGRGRLPALLDPGRLAPVALAVAVLVSGGAALAGAGATEALVVAPWLAAVLLPGAWLAFLQRAGYFHLNARATPRALILRLGALDAGLAVALAVLTVVAGPGPLVLVWLFYVVRIALQIGMMRRLVTAGVRD